MESVCVDSRGVLTVKSSCRNMAVGVIKSNIASEMGIQESAFYLVRNGKKLSDEEQSNDAGNKGHEVDTLPISVVFRVLGGKGGFGSMLRAIGAQIEKTTNRDACRDLSGRRLRDINEEQRLKRWFAKQNERELEKEEARKKKIEKLKRITEGPPLPVIDDEQYNKQRADMVDSVYEAVDKGFEVRVHSKAASSTASATATSSTSDDSSKDSSSSSSDNGTSKESLTKADEEPSSSAGPSKSVKVEVVKRKTFKKLMMDEDLDSCSSSDSDEDEESLPKKAKLG